MHLCHNICQESGTDGSSTGGPAERDILDTFLEEGFSTFAQVPVKAMKAILSALEPATLSGYALKGLCRGNAREPSKESLLEVLEFMTDVPPHLKVGSNRSLRAIVTFLFIKFKEYKILRTAGLRSPASTSSRVSWRMTSKRSTSGEVGRQLENDLRTFDFR